MPTRQTHLPSESGRDAAGRGHDVSVAWVKDAMDDGLAASSTRGILNWLKRCWRTFQQRRQRHASRIDVRDLSERELKDIGLPSAEIERIAAHRALDRLRDGTAYLWRPPRGRR
jgi:uncharacterized protein YjiS (DUF1127 family)